MSTGADAASTGTSLASDPQHPAPQRSLWIGGLSAEVSDELLQSRLEAVRARVATACASSRDFLVRRMPEASGAWVDASDDLAQEIITVLNGTTLGPGAILVRYSRQVTSPSPSPSPSPIPSPRRDHVECAGALSSPATRARASSPPRRPVRPARCPTG